MKIVQNLIESFLCKEYFLCV